jgi:hypothetical protein
MDRLHQAVQRFLALFRARTYERELDTEIATHLEFAIEENIKRGLPPAAALNSPAKGTATPAASLFSKKFSRTCASPGARSAKTTLSPSSLS